MRYPHLFTPLRLGPVEARNRVVFGANFTGFADPAPTWGEPGHWGERYGRYLAERARGGAGVVIAGQTHVHPTTAYQLPNNATAWDEAALPGFRAVTERVHAHGALAFVQLAHNGGVNGGAHSKLPAWAPSAVPNREEMPKPLEPHEIRELVDYFARSAANAAAGGFDGIEIHGGHGYLIHEFLSPRSNLREDAYGGSLANRMRFGEEVLRAVREAAGPGLAVGLRLVGDEEVDDGLSADDCAEIAARFEALGLVDFLNVSVGLSGIGMVRPLYAPHGFGVYASRAVRERVRGTPVCAVHRILTPEEAEAILARGDADAVTVVRALIADPEWAEKARTGREDRIRRCTGSNQGCYGNLFKSHPITCVTNPAVGREASLGLGTLTPAARRRRVVVVGGGPGGLEAAWVAAARGHEVVLLERDAHLGGKVRWARRLPGRAEMGDLADWRARECERRGVAVRLGEEASADSVLALEPEAVVVATGARASTRARAKAHAFPIPGAERDFVIDHERALRDADRIAGRVVILDAVGHIEGAGLAELLASAGCDVELVCPLPILAELDAETHAQALPRAVRAGARWTPSTAVREVRDGEVVLEDLLSGRTRTRPVDVLVVRTHGVADDALYFALRELRGIDVHRVGDALAPRTVDRAIFDGHVAARAL